jgi:hypothetical protein
VILIPCFPLRSLRFLFFLAFRPPFMQGSLITCAPRTTAEQGVTSHIHSFPSFFSLLFFYLLSVRPFVFAILCAELVLTTD